MMISFAACGSDCFQTRSRSTATVLASLKTAMMTDTFMVTWMDRANSMFRLVLAQVGSPEFGISCVRSDCFPCLLRCGSAYLGRTSCAPPLLHHDQEMISHTANHRPSGHTPIQSPQALVPARMFLANPRQVRRRCEHTQPAIVLEREIRFEGSIELAWTVVAGPDGVIIHADGHDIARKAQFRPSPTSTPQIMSKLPRADPADHREHERASGVEQARTFPRHVGEVGNAIERAEVRVRAVKHALAFQAVQLVSTHGERSYPIRQVLALGTVAGPLHHLRRPIGGRYM